MDKLIGMLISYYWAINNGITLQWGSFLALGGTGRRDVTLPISYQNYCIIVTASVSTQGTNSWTDESNCSKRLAQDYASYIHQPLDNVTSFGIQKGSSRKYVVWGY